MRIQLQAEQEQAILVAQAYAELALKGEGGPEALGQGVGLVTETAKLEQGEAKKDLEAQLAENQKTINAIKAQGTDVGTDKQRGHRHPSGTSVAAIDEYGVKVAETSAKSQTQGSDDD